MTNDEIERQAFERWCINKCNYPLTRIEGSKSYVACKTKMAWEVWQAAWQARARQENNDD